ncbi:MAG: hypothetical protein KC502_23890, partial [Myxococcales bacterium]|nr:hypothetical protein [Myxococcales bacterium]
MRLQIQGTWMKTSLLMALVMTAPMAVGLSGCEVDPQMDWSGADGLSLDGVQAHHLTAGDEALANDHEALLAQEPVSGGVGALVLPSGDALELTGLTVDATASAGMADVTVLHTFHNPLEAQVEGKFVFTVPAGAIVTGLKMKVSGKWMSGEIVERRKAERIYRQIVDRMRDPALLRWQGDGRLELRIFPIEAESDKLIELRLLVPLRGLNRNATGRAESAESPDAVLRYGLGGQRSTVPIGRVVIRTDGVERFSGTDVDRSHVVTLPFTQQRTQPWVQQHGATRFVSVPLRLPKPPKQAASASRTVVVLVDRSRSALESVGMQEEVLRAVLQAGEADDQFIVAKTDISCEPDPTGFSRTDDLAIDRAVTWVLGGEPDGASDLGQALRCARQLFSGQPTEGRQVVLVGDGVATWGELDEAKLLASAKAIGAPIHAAAVGKATAVALLRGLTMATGGQVFVPRTAGAVARFGQFIAQAARMGRWRDVRVTSASGVVQPSELGTLFGQQQPWVVVQVPPGAPMPTALRVTSARNRTGWRLPIGEDVRPATGLRQRFGQHAVHALQQQSAKPAEIVTASQRYGVLSKYTALLVLESEEAYKRFGIKRRAQQASDNPTVSGADLESISGGPSVSPDRIQPGDPEVRVPAPKDARRVTVTLPWGERLRAKWEPASDHGPAAWVARFLVDLSVPEGRYPLHIEVVHADGHQTTQELQLTVDTTAPSIRLTVTRSWRGTFVVRARQLAPVGARDARGVEVRMPDGQVVPLTALRLGVFVGRWRPAMRVSWPLTVEAFAIDRSLNQRSAKLTLRRSGEVVRMGPGRMGQLPTANHPGDLHGVVVPKVGMDITHLVRWQGKWIAGTLADGLWTRKNDQPWQRLQTGAPVDRRINRLQVGAQGALWVATTRGLYKITQRHEVQAWGIADGLPASDVHSLWVPTSSRTDLHLIAGTARGAVLLTKKGRIKPLGIKQGLPVRAVWDVVQTGDGAIWLGSSWGAYRYHDGVAERFSVATGHLTDDWVTALSTDGQRVFVGTYQGGVTQLAPAGDDTFVAAHLGGRHINLGGLHIHRGTLWASTMEGAMTAKLIGNESAGKLGFQAAKRRNVTAVGVHGD